LSGSLDLSRLSDFLANRGIFHSDLEVKWKILPR